MIECVYTVRTTKGRGGAFLQAFFTSETKKGVCVCVVCVVASYFMVILLLKKVSRLFSLFSPSLLLEKKKTCEAFSLSFFDVQRDESFLIVHN